MLRTDGAFTSSTKRLSTVKEKPVETSLDSDVERFEQNLRKMESDEADVQQRIKIARGDLQNMNNYLLNSCAVLQSS